MRFRLQRSLYPIGAAICLLGCFATTVLAADLPVAPAAAPSDQPYGKPNDNSGKSDKEEGWQPVNTQMIQPGESFEAKNLVAVGYGFIWVMVAGFVLSVWRRSDRLDSEIEALRTQIKQRGPAGR